MAERLREMLERPLDPRFAKAIIVLACAVTSGFAVLVLLAGTEGSAQIPLSRRTVGTTPRVASTAPLAELPSRPRSRRSQEREKAHPAQDPQDRRGSAASHRADRELAKHRALQHVPYRRGAVAITVVGARGERAVLRVSAPTLGAARRGWRAFLRRYHDTGSSYIPNFAASEAGGADG